MNITYQAATCCLNFDARTNFVFVTDAAQANVTTLNVVDGSIMATMSYDRAAVGDLDSVVVRSSLYILSAAATVVNIVIRGVIRGLAAGRPARQVQNFVPLPTRSNGTLPVLQGMASYPSY